MKQKKLENRIDDLKVIGAIGKNYCIYIKEGGKYALYDRQREEHIDEKFVDQKKVMDVLLESNEESKEILRVL